jgi:hypothetical protein
MADLGNAACEGTRGNGAWGNDPYEMAHADNLSLRFISSCKLFATLLTIICN